ncbi:MAG: oxidoreductase, partial [Planctomycetota bacterium]
RYLSGSTLFPPLLSPSLVRQTIPGTRMIITGFTGPYTLEDKTSAQSERIVHICAGSGIVPSYSIIKHDLRVNEKSKHLLIYSNKTISDAIFFKQLKAVEEEFPNRLQVIHTLTREKNENLFNSKVRKGRVSKELIAEFIPDPKSVKIFTCGPDHSVWQKKIAKEKGTPLAPSFMGDVLSALEKIGISPQQITKESYG